MKIGPTRYHITAAYVLRGGTSWGDLGEHPASMDDVTAELMNWLDSRHSQFRVLRTDYDHETDAFESARDVTEEVMDAITELSRERNDDYFVPAMNDRPADWATDDADYHCDLIREAV